jgi:hypothetical protein
MRLLREVAADDLGLWEAFGIVVSSAYWLSEHEAEALAEATVRDLLSAGLAEIRRRGPWQEAAVATSGVVVGPEEAEAVLGHTDRRRAVEITVDGARDQRTYWLSITKKGSSLAEGS